MSKNLFILLALILMAFTMYSRPLLIGYRSKESSQEKSLLAKAKRAIEQSNYQNFIDILQERKFCIHDIQELEQFAQNILKLRSAKLELAQYSATKKNAISSHYYIWGGVSAACAGTATILLATIPATPHATGLPATVLYIGSGMLVAAAALPLIIISAGIAIGIAGVVSYKYIKHLATKHTKDKNRLYQEACKISNTLTNCRKSVSAKNKRTPPAVLAEAIA